MRLDVYIHDVGADHKLDRIISMLGEVIHKEVVMAGELDALTAQVTENTTLEGSAITLIQGIAQKLADAIAAGNPAALTALQVQLKTSADALAAAITANTPASP
jgi:hypothetical protein